MGRRFQPAMFPGLAPHVISGKYKTAETFQDGAPLVLDANGELTECGADPALINGVALEPVASKPGWDMANSPTVVTGRVQEVSYCVADRMTVWSGRGINGGTDPVTPTQTMIGESYGIVKSGTDWVIDISDTTNTRVRIIDIDIDNKIFYFKWLEANIPSN